MSQDISSLYKNQLQFYLLVMKNWKLKLKAFIMASLHENLGTPLKNV